MKYRYAVEGGCWFLFLFAFGSGIAQPNVGKVIRGQVVDASLGKPIAGATVSILELDSIGAVSDSTGYFEIVNMPVGHYRIKSSHLTFLPRIYYDIIVQTGREVFIRIELSEKVQTLDEVIISFQDTHDPINESFVVSTLAFSVEETRRYAGSFDDPLRMAASFPGVSSSGSEDVSNEISIRGNSPRGLLWMMEGLEIPSPNHFAEIGGATGAVSMLSAQILDKSDFSTGAFPAEYGNGLSGVFDIKLRSGNNSVYQHRAKASLVGFDAASEGPLGKKSSYIVNGRYSALGLLFNLGIQPIDASKVAYQDLTFKMNFPTSKGNYFSVFGLSGSSVYEDNRFFPIDQTKLTDGNGSSLSVLGFKHHYITNDKSFLETSAAFTRSNIFNQFSVSTSSIPLGDSPEYDEKFKDNNIRIKVLYSHPLGERINTKTGIIATRQSYLQTASHYNRRLDETTQVLDASGDADVLQAFTSWRMQPSKYLTFNAGVHVSYFSINGQTAAEPRASVRLKLSSRQSVAFGYGLHSKRENPALYLINWENDNGITRQPNRTLRFTQASHFVLSYQINFSDYFSIKTEAYYQDLTKIPASTTNLHESLLNYSGGLISDSLVNVGFGSNRGIEMTVNRSFHNKYFLLGAFSFYNSDYVAKDGIKRSTAYNNRHLASLSTGKEWKLGKHSIISSSLRVLSEGGRPYTPILLAESIAQGTEIRDESKAYGSIAPAYNRLDFQLSFKWNKPKISSEVKIDIQNVFESQRILRYAYDPVSKIIYARTSGHIVPIISYSIDF